MFFKKQFLRVKQDPLGMMQLYFRKLYFGFWMTLDSSFSQLKLCLNGISFGKNARFLGRILVSRFPGSKIVIGDNVFFNSSGLYNLIGVNRCCSLATLTSSARVYIGDNSRFSGTVIGAFKSIYIGKDVKCGANTLITDSDWHLDDKRSSPPANVVIEDGVWLGVNVVVLKGVRIGKNSVIGANSVVSRSIPDNSIAAGIPCRVLKEVHV